MAVISLDYNGFLDENQRAYREYNAPIIKITGILKSDDSAYFISNSNRKETKTTIPFVINEVLNHRVAISNPSILKGCKYLLTPEQIVKKQSKQPQITDEFLDGVNRFLEQAMAAFYKLSKKNAQSVEGCFYKYDLSKKLLLVCYCRNGVILADIRKRPDYIGKTMDAQYAVTQAREVHNSQQCAEEIAQDYINL